VLSGVLAIGAQDARARTPAARGKIIVLMVWDGLRPDLVDESSTPNLLALARAGVHFSRHHSIYPTLTMVNATALATGATPGASGIAGNSLYLAPFLDLSRAHSIPLVGDLIDDPINLESSGYLAALNGSRAFDGHLLGLQTTAQQVEHAGGYVAVLGKQGPTFLFDDNFLTAQAESGSPQDFMFVADDLAAPSTVAESAHAPPMKRNDYPSVIARDAWFAKLAIDRALPAAVASSDRGKPAFVVLWQHNPDLTQHVAGLGTQPAFDALRACDANLASLRKAIAALGIADRTDLMVVSDHGFATIKAIIRLGQLLVDAGLKKSRKSKEIVVAGDGGTESIYLSRTDFPTVEARREVLRQIVEFAAAHEWAGPIFSRRLSPAKQTGRHGYTGSIEGTFDESAFGLENDVRAPDLIISFRELSDLDNRALTPGLVRPIPGLLYADADGFADGMGMHGAAGARELHNYCAAIGPDFRHRLVDMAPTGNADVAPTIAKILGQPPVAGITGRVINEALAAAIADSHRGVEPVTAITSLNLKNSRVTTTLNLTRYAGHEYLDDAHVTVTPAR
jgi:arylsulfatase A-like enzyme